MEIWNFVNPPHPVNTQQKANARATTIERDKIATEHLCLVSITLATIKCTICFRSRGRNGWFLDLALNGQPRKCLFRHLTLIRQLLMCHRAVENQPLVGSSKPATLRCVVDIMFLDSNKGN